MRLATVCQFLSTMERYKESMDGTNCTIKCPFCGDSKKSADHGHLSIKIDVKRTEPMVMQCFRADCGYKGILTTKILQDFGCHDMSTIVDLANHNKNISTSIEKGFVEKSNRGLELVNLDSKENHIKLHYINDRLGVNFQPHDLRKFKIQLNLYQFLNLNQIRKLSFSKSQCDLLDQYTIGFISTYHDYMICRDISDDMITGKRYHNYRLMGKPDLNDMKIYSIPMELDILDPSPATIHVAEGPFSILGAYLHTKHKPYDTKNTIWAANCGFEYYNTIIHFCRQYGLLKIILHVWSDSEIGVKRYEELFQRLSERISIVYLFVHYNTLADDFGHRRSEIRVETITLDK